MKNIDLEVKKIAFKSPLTINGKSVTSRKCGILTLEEDGFLYQGELCDLPGFFDNTFEENIKQLSSLLEKYLSLEEILSNENLNPQLLFCIEGLLLDKKFNKLNIEIDVNSLYLPETNEDLEDSKCIKYKIGRKDIGTEKKSLIEAFSKFPNSTFRLDANRSLSKEELLELMLDLPKEQIDYLEEPLKDIDEWNYINEEIKCALAIDESLPKFINAFDFPNNTKSVVLKPTKFLGPYKAIALIEKLSEKNINVVVSSTFESPIGIKTHKIIAHHQNQIQATFAGLDTLKYLNL